jgi:hypothetical protein
LLLYVLRQRGARQTTSKTNKINKTNKQKHKIFKEEITTLFSVHLY